MTAQRMPILLGMIALAVLMACAGPRPLPILGGAIPSDVAHPKAPGDQAEVFFITDRSVRTDAARRATYSSGRDAAMSFGRAVLTVENPQRPRILGLRETLRFPATPLPFSQRDGRVIPDQQAQADYSAIGRAMQAELGRALREGNRRDVLLYVHGFHSQFGTNLQTTIGLWHATDQTTLPLAFSWPSGNPGALGYFKDRESGEFSIFHFKQTLRLLAGTPGVRRIHIIAHSRGSDVATTALRELVIETRAAGREPREALKIENLILAAPDLDFSVVRQRLIAERFGPAFGRITVYMNPQDGALGLAQILMAGTRFGRLSYDQLHETERRIFTQIGNVHFINVSAVIGQSSHSYFRKNPEVLADISQVITTGAPPDSPQRNLESVDANFWNLVLPPRVKVRDRKFDP